MTVGEETLDLEIVLRASQMSLYRLLATLSRKRAVVERLAFEAHPEYHRVRLTLRVPAGRGSHILEVVTGDPQVTGVATSRPSN